MTPKRSSTDAALHSVYQSLDKGKRIRLSPPVDEKSESSTSTTTHISEASALRSSSRDSNVSSQSSLQFPSEEESEGTDSEDEDSSSSDSASNGSVDREGGDIDDLESDTIPGDEVVVNLGGPKKPTIDNQRVMGDAGELHKRLQHFLPRIKAANSTLVGNGDRLRTIEDVDEGEEYIEMNLGLGVLEEKTDDPTEDDDGSGHDHDAMSELLGIKTRKDAVGVEEVHDT